MSIVIVNTSAGLSVARAYDGPPDDKANNWIFSIGLNDRKGGYFMWARDWATDVRLPNALTLEEAIAAATAIWRMQ